MQKAFQSRTQLFAKIEALLFGALIFSLTACSQGSTYLIKAGKHPAKILPDTVQFQYPDFQKGILVLPMGEKSPVILLNYNLLYATIQLINENGDTLALDENANIVEYVRIESDLYFRDHKEGYCLIVSKEGPVKVVVRFKLNIVRLFLQNEDVYFRKDYDYFFLAQKNKLFKPTKTSLHKLYPEHKKAIQTFISENNVNFGNESDLTRLISYCNALPPETNTTE